MIFGRALLVVAGTAAFSAAGCSEDRRQGRGYGGGAADVAARALPAAAKPPSTVALAAQALSSELVTASAGGAVGAVAPATVVILMMPLDGSADQSAKQKRTYRFAVTTDLNTASVEVDGRPAVLAKVQRVYPSRDADGPANMAPAGSGVPGRVPKGASTTESPRARYPGASLSHASRVAVSAPRFPSPNGAPIID